MNDNADGFVEGNGTVRRRRAVEADLDGYVSELLVKAVGDGALDGELTSSERAALVDHLRAVSPLGSSDRGYETAPGAADRPGQIGAPEPLDLLLAMGIARRERAEEDHRRAWHQAMPMFQPVDGMDAIVDALAADLRSS